MTEKGKIILLNNEWYLLNNAMLKNIGYTIFKDQIVDLPVKSYAHLYAIDCKNIIASTTELPNVPLLDKQNIQDQINGYGHNWEARKIVAAQQYALNEAETRGHGQLTRIKNAWENGFETCQKAIEYNKDQLNRGKLFTLDEMKKAINLAYVSGFENISTYQKEEEEIVYHIITLQEPEGYGVEYEIKRPNDDNADGDCQQCSILKEGCSCISVNIRIIREL